MLTKCGLRNIIGTILILLMAEENTVSKVGSDLVESNAVAEPSSEGNIEARKYVVIVDNVELWREHIAAVVREACPGVEILFAGSASEAMQVIAGVRERVGKVDLLLTDLHMSEDPEENGPALLTRLDYVRFLPPSAIVSGTLADPVRTDLSTATKLPVLSKDAFWPGRDDLDPVRAAAVESIRTLLNSGEKNVINLRPLSEYILRNSERLSEISKNRIFVDEVKARTGSVVGDHGKFLSTFDNGVVNFLLEPDLQDDTGVKLHEFKNQLANLLRELSRCEDLPEGLMAAMAALHVWINTFLREGVENPETTNIVDIAEGICSNFRAFSGFRDRIRFKSSIEELNVPIDSASFSRMLIEMIQNALTHSTGDVEVEIDHQIQRIYVVSRSSRELRVYVVDDHKHFYTKDVQQETDQDVRLVAATSSGKGVDFLIEEATRLGLRFDLLSLGHGEVSSAITWDNDDSGHDKGVDIVEETEDGLEHLVEMPTVIFICHDGRGKQTFEDLLEKQMPGYKYVILQMPSHDVPTEFFEQKKVLLDSSALVVLHMDEGQYGEWLTPLREVAPHISFLPAAMQARFLRLDKYLQDFEQYPDPYLEGLLNVIKISDIAEFFDAHGRHMEPEELEDLESRLYLKDYSPEDWELLLNVAQYLAKKRKAADAE